MSLADRQPGETGPPGTQPPIGELWVEVRTVGAGTVFAVRGEVDIRTAPVLTGYVDRHFGAGTVRRPLVFDLTEVGFLGSAGLGVLLDAHGRASAEGVAVWIVAASRAVRRPIQITGLTGVLTVVGDLATALDAIG